MKKKIIILLLFLPAVIIVAAQKKQLLTIHFEHRFGTEKLVPEQTYYLDDSDTLVINRFKYYLSHIQLINAKGEIFTPKNDYYLINSSEETSMTIQLSIPEGKYTGIQFLLGVDSIRNVSGVQTGALDPLHGMFWTWNSGYVMAKLEGTSSSSKMAGKQFTYHIGGFRNKQRTSRKISLTGAYANELTILADAKNWFDGPNKISVAKEPICHSPGELAVRIADNYSRMFSIKDKQ